MRSKLNLFGALLTLAVCATAVSAQVTTYPYLENFETGVVGNPGTLPSGWTQSTADNWDWRVHSGGTGSSLTGPSGDHTTGTGKYVYYESSSPTSIGQTMIMVSPQFDFSSFTGPPVLDFWYHMYGSSMGTMHIDMTEQFNSASDGDLTVGTSTFVSAASTFVASHVGSNITITGSANGNNGTYTIASVLNSTTVTLTSTPAGTNETGITFVHDIFTSDIVTPFTDNVNAWQNMVVNLSFVRGGSEALFQLEFRGVRGSSFRSDMALDDISIVAPTPAAPVITSTAPTAVFATVPYTYTPTATGAPWPTFSISPDPATLGSGWLTWTGGNTLSGTPAAGDAGTYGPFTITATNAIAPDDTEVFSVVVSIPNPEMDVSRAATAIASGSTDAVATPNYPGLTLPLTYTIDNTATDPLDLTGVSGLVVQSNAVNCVAVIVDPTTNPIPGSGSDTFSVTITPTAVGAWSVDLSIDNTDQNENPYTFTISGTAVVQQPEMEVSRAATPVADGGTDTVATINYPLFALPLTYTIDNIGVIGLNLTGTSGLVTHSNAVNCVVLVNDPSTSTISPAGSTTFGVTITPLAAGAWSVDISIDNDDLNENPYDFTIDGSATLPDPEMDLSRAATPIADAGTDTIATVNYPGTALAVLVYTIDNTGTDPLSLTGVGVLVAQSNAVNCTVAIVDPTTNPILGAGSTTFSVTITPTAAGAWSVDLSIDNNDQNENPYNFTIDGTATAPAPEMDLSRAATPIADASTDTVATVNYPGVAMAALVYTIDNTAADPLTLSGSPDLVAQSNAVNCSVTIVDPTTNPIAGTSSTTFSVTITPTAAGAWSVDLSIANDDANENPYNFVIDGTATAPAPEMDLSRAATPIADAGTDAVAGSSFFGNALQLTYTIDNTATDPLTLSGSPDLVAQSNAVNCNVTITDPTVNPILGGNSDTFTISVVPTAIGAWSIDLSIANDDANENPYNFTVSGTAIGPVNTFPYLQDFEGAHSWSTSGPANDWALGTPASVINSAASGANSWVTNLTGNYRNNHRGAVNSPPFDFSALTSDPLISLSIWWDSENSWDGTVLQSSIDGGATWQRVGDNGDPTNWYNDTTINGLQSAVGDGIGWTGSPGSAGWVTATHALDGLAGQSDVLLRFYFGSDGSVTDQGCAIDDISITLVPEMDVQFLGSSVADGSTTAAVTDILAATTSTLTFTIENLGAADLTVGAISFSAPANVGVPTVSLSPTSPVTPSGTTTFNVDVTPAAPAGNAYSFVMSIVNDDPNENPYNFTVSGNVVSNLPPVVSVPVGSNWVNAGGGVYTLTLNPGDSFNDALTATDATPDNMSLTVTAPTTTMTTVTAEPATAAAAAGPLTLQWTGTADASNVPGDYEWTVDINDGTTSVVITARITVTDVAPTHVIANATSGDGSTATPYSALFLQGDDGTVTVDLAILSDGNTGQTLALGTVNNVTSPGGSTGSFNFTLVSGTTLNLAPGAALAAADAGIWVYDIDVTDGGANTITIRVAITVGSTSGSIVFSNAANLRNGLTIEIYTESIIATGGTAPYVYSIVSGSLPGGLSFDSDTGAISGTPTLNGDYSFDVRAMDSAFDTATMTFHIHIGPVSSGDGGGKDDDSGCAAGTSGHNIWLALLALLGLVVMTRLRREAA